MTKEVASGLAIILIVIGYAPYIRDTVSGKTKPHIFSWLIWTIVTSVIYALQVSAGAGAGSWVTLGLVFLLLIILLLSIKNGSSVIKKIDVLFFILALLAIPLWLIVDQPVFSIILLSSIDMLAFVPTIRKSWEDPYSETLSLYVVTTFRHVLGVYALAQYNIITALFPVTWIVANALLSVILVIRRKQVRIDAD